MRYIQLFLIVIVSFSWSCTLSTQEANSTLSVTNSPQKYFLDRIVGDRFTVNTIIGPGENPESMDLTPSQILRLSKTKAYFKIGYLDIENILVSKVKDSNPNLLLFECSDGIEIIKEGCNTAHEHDTNQPHSHADGDPHVWSSPASAKVIAKNMYNAMLEITGYDDGYYALNQNKLIASIDSTDRTIRAYLDKADTRTFIIYHPALSYFAKEYDLEQLSIEFEGKQPSPSHLKTLIEEAKAKKVKVVFIQKEFDIKNAETIAQSIGAKTVVIDLLAYDWSEEMIKIAKAIASTDE